MTEKQCLGEGGFMTDINICDDKKTMLEAISTGVFDKERNCLLLLTHDFIGSDDEAGRKLMSALLKTVSSSRHMPRSMVLTDKAVRFACKGDDELGSLCCMEALGTEILVSRLSLHEYAKADGLCCGMPADTVEIWSALYMADKVITF